MKVVVAEKISAFRHRGVARARWTIVTPDQIDGKLACSTRLRRCADRALGGAGGRGSARACHKLRVIGRAGVGVDNIDLDAATRKGIAVMNTPGANAIAVAEHTLAMMLAMARHLCRADA